MNLTFLFIFATCGLVWITNKSKLFKSVREFFTKKHLADKTNQFYWFMSSLFECSGCMSVWAAGAVGACIHYDILYPLYPLVVVMPTVFLVSLLQLIERK